MCIRDRVGSIELKITYKANNTLVFAVTDTGIGIKEENLDKLFTLFGKLEEEGKGRKLNPTGVGLGLTISNDLSRMLGSELGIQVKSVYGEGSSFFFELPCVGVAEELEGHNLHSRDRLLDSKAQVIFGIGSSKRHSFNTGDFVDSKSSATSHMMRKIECGCVKVLLVDDNDFSQTVFVKSMKFIGQTWTQRIMEENALKK
eukprot:TRINITY_DN5421_c0_g1_i1.p1 TRINITY_DN5421_c0_g1~~TRINITY_DN5421_c0_g1_i1.p1  ORF type:complete len:221 (-),score=39.09 TRINITY_DN5421_c0_g1_i1:327-929(-)